MDSVHTAQQLLLTHEEGRGNQASVRVGAGHDLEEHLGNRYAAVPEYRVLMRVARENRGRGARYRRGCSTEHRKRAR